MLEAAALGGTSAPTEVLIAPWGRVESASGMFVVDEEAARLVIKAFAEHGTDLPIDYEHQTLGGAYSSPSGQAPAAGWIRSLRAAAPGEREDGRAGLLACVEWTPGAAEKLMAREYRYLSPVVIVRSCDRRVVALHSAALTNKPAIARMQPLVNRQAERGAAVIREQGGTDSPPQDQTETNALETLCMKLRLSRQEGVGAVLAAAAARIDALEQDVRQREAAEKVLAATRAGKLTGAQRAWAVALAMKDPTGFEQWLATAPVIVRPGWTEAAEEAVDPVERDRERVAASARATFRAEPALALITSEAAWVNEALRHIKRDADHGHRTGGAFQ